MSKSANASPDREQHPIIENGGVTTKLFDKTANSLDSIVHKIQTAAGEKSAAFKEFEDGGGNKRGLRRALQLMNLPADERMDAYRTEQAYLKHLGFFDQKDLFDQNNGENAGTVTALSPEQVKEAQAAKEKSIGPAQAQAISALH